MEELYPRQAAYLMWSSGHVPASDSPGMLNLQCKHLWRYGERRRGRVVQRWRRLLADTIHTSTSWKFATMGYCIAWAREGGGKSQFAFEVWTISEQAEKESNVFTCYDNEKVGCNIPCKMRARPARRQTLFRRFSRGQTGRQERGKRYSQISDPLRTGLEIKGISQERPIR